MFGSERLDMRSGQRKMVAAAAGLATLAAVNWAAARAAERRRDGNARMGELESRWYEVHDLRMHALVSTEPVPRDRLPVVLVHGLGVSSRYMVPIARHLAPDFRVFAPDLQGFGW